LLLLPGERKEPVGRLEFPRPRPHARGSIVPDPEVSEKKHRRSFTAKHRLYIRKEADKIAVIGGIGAYYVVRIIFLIIDHMEKTLGKRAIKGLVSLETGSEKNQEESPRTGNSQASKRE
jgi:hypothetical protein